MFSMNIRIRSGAALALLAFLTLVLRSSAQQSGASGGTEQAPEPPPRLERFIGCSDVVALVGVSAAELTEAGTVYSTRVLRPIKGTTPQAEVYFVGPGGGRVGSKLIVFLKRDTSTVARYLASHTRRRSLFAGIDAPMHLPVFGTNAMIDIDVPIEVASPQDAQQGKEWGHVVLRNMEFPPELLTHVSYRPSAPGTIQELARFRWIPVEDLVTWLDSAAKTNPPCVDTPFQPQPVIDEMPLEYGIIPGGSRVVRSLDSVPRHITAAIIAHMKSRVPDTVLRRFVFRTILAGDSARYRVDPDRPNGVAPYEANFIYSDPAAGITGMRAWVLLDWDGKIVDSLRFPDMVHNPAKRRVLSRAEADRIARAKSDGGAPLGSFIGYDPKLGSLVWHLRYGTADDQAHYREIWIDAHSGSTVAVYDMTAVRIGAGSR